MTRAQIKTSLLKQLLAHDGHPAPESALYAGVKFSDGRVPISDITLALEELETARLASANFDSVSEVKTWTLTDAGLHRAKQLR